MLRDLNDLKEEFKKIIALKKDLRPKKAVSIKTRMGEENGYFQITVLREQFTDEDSHECLYMREKMVGTWECGVL